jgi:hypothetical protein
MSENLNATQLADMADKAEEGKTIAKAAAKAGVTALRTLQAQSDKPEFRKLCKAVFEYFDSGAHRSVDGYDTIDAALTAIYKLPDAEALKNQRDRVTYWRKIGAKVAGKALAKGGTTGGNGDRPTVDKAVDYLKTTWSKLDSADKVTLLKLVQRLYNADKATDRAAQAGKKLDKAA